VNICTLNSRQGRGGDHYSHTLKCIIMQTLHCVYTHNVMCVQGIKLQAGQKVVGMTIVPSGIASCLATDKLDANPAGGCGCGCGCGCANVSTGAR
jgi:hypothetical protein